MDSYRQTPPRRGFVVLWYNGKMTYTNLYRPSSSLVVPNAGLGNNPLEMPLSKEVASIEPSIKYARYIDAPAGFEADFYADEPTFSLWFVAKPNPGVLAQFLSHSLVYTGHSYVISNDADSYAEIPEHSRSVHRFVIVRSEQGITFSVDNDTVLVESDTVSEFEPPYFSVLHAGGVLGAVGADNTDVSNQFEPFEFPLPQEEINVISDSTRGEVEERLLAETVYTAEYGLTRLDVPMSECLGFKVNYAVTGEGDVLVNGDIYTPGSYIAGSPQKIEAVSGDRPLVLHNVVLTEYHSEQIGETSGATILVDGATGRPSPAALQDDFALTGGDTIVTLDEDVESVSGWFKADNGAVLPGVEMNGGVLTGTDLYVNGSPYGGQSIVGWYFLTSNSPMSGAVNITAPVHSLAFSDTALTPEQIDDMYESFFGNPSVSAPAQRVRLTERPSVMVSTEWDIVASG